MEDTKIGTQKATDANNKVKILIEKIKASNEAGKKYKACLDAP